MSQATKPNRHELPGAKGAAVAEIMGGRTLVVMGENKTFYRNFVDGDGSVTTERISRGST